MHNQSGNQITIITPTLNSEEYILENLKSIHLKNKGSEPKQLIIDGLSTDNTIDIVNSFRSQHNCDISLIQKKDKNMYQAVNTGLKEVRTTYWACLNSDDSYLPNALEKCLIQIRRKDAKFAVAQCAVVSTNNKSLYTIKPIPTTQTGLASYGKCSALPQPSTIFHIEMRELAGFYSEDYRIAGDYDYALRACKLADPYILNTTLTNFLQRTDSISGSTNGSHEAQLIHSSLDIHPTSYNKFAYRLAFAFKNFSTSSLRRNFSLIKNLVTK